MRLFTHIFVASLLLAHTALWAAEKYTGVDPAWENLTFTIEDSRAFVGFAPVYLSVSELTPEDGKLVGTYEIRVPLKTSKNDEGKIVLPLSLKVSELGNKGGVLKGEAHSEKDQGVVSEIVCVILPKKDQSIQLAITTKNRTINFKSRYSLVEASQDG